MSEFAELFGGSSLAGWRTGSLDGARAVLAMQGAALAAMTPLANDWLHRREEALAAAGRLLDELGSANDPMEAVQAHQAWLSGATQRLTEDAAAWLRFGTALWRVPAAGMIPEATPEPARPPHRARTPAMAT